MAKKFAARVSKRDRSKKDIAAHLDERIFRLNDEKLLKGAQLDNIKLSKITVKKQVRTKFNDSSIAELAANIKENGLIQPLVVHREGSHYVLICGERRFRAMSTLPEMKEAPCFILENNDFIILSCIKILSLNLITMAFSESFTAYSSLAFSTLSFMKGGTFLFVASTSTN